MGKFDETARKLADAQTKHDEEAVGKLYASDAFASDPMYPEPMRGRDAIQKEAADFFRGFPDLRFEILTLVTKDDRSGAAEVRLTGTNTGPLVTPTGEEIPATQKRVEIKAAAFVKLNDRGEILEEIRYYDVGTFLRQLGLMPEQAEQPAAAKS